jgi:hypothetical protein
MPIQIDNVPPPILLATTTDEILKLKKLFDDGVLTDSEFTQAKSKLLNS